MSLTNTQRDNINNFKAFTGVTDDGVCKTWLESRTWNVNRAVNDWFTTDPSQRPKPQANNLINPFVVDNPIPIQPERKRQPKPKKPKTPVLKYEEKVGASGCVQIRFGDLCGEKVDAIVNPANKDLVHGSGLSAHIVSIGGDTINDLCAIWKTENNELEEGRVMHTRSGDGMLECRYIIHAVGPMWHGGNNDEASLLQMTVQNCFREAEKLGCQSIAIPAISTGIFGYPKDRSTKIIWKASVKYLKDNKNRQSRVKQIRLTSNDQSMVQEFKTALDNYRTEEEKLARKKKIFAKKKKKEKKILHSVS